MANTYKRIKFDDFDNLDLVAEHQNVSDNFIENLKQHKPDKLSPTI